MSEFSYGLAVPTIPDVAPTTPTGAPLGYGLDLDLQSDLTENMGTVDPFSVVALTQAIVRRLDCPRGALPDDPDYGEDVRGMLSTGITTASLRSISTRVAAELKKDDRILALVVDVTPSSSASSILIALTVTPADPNVGPFKLVLEATSADLLIAEMNA